MNDKLKEIYGELVQTRRDDQKYVQLTILENKGLQEQTRIGVQLNQLENEERDHFTQLATAIKEYHDSQAMNAQKYKYLSILASAFLAILSLSGSMIYNNRRIADVRNVIAEAQKNNDETFWRCFNTLQTESSQKFSQILSILETNSATEATPQLHDSEIVSENQNLINFNLTNGKIALCLGSLAVVFYALRQ